MKSTSFICSCELQLLGIPIFISFFCTTFSILISLKVLNKLWLSEEFPFCQHGNLNMNRWTRETMSYIIMIKIFPLLDFEKYLSSKFNMSRSMGHTCQMKSPKGSLVMRWGNSFWLCFACFYLNYWFVRVLVMEAKGFQQAYIYLAKVVLQWSVFWGQSMRPFCKKQVVASNFSYSPMTGYFIFVATTEWPYYLLKLYVILAACCMRSST